MNYLGSRVGQNYITINKHLYFAFSVIGTVIVLIINNVLYLVHLNTASRAQKSISYVFICIKHKNVMAQKTTLLTEQIVFIIN